MTTWRARDMSEADCRRFKRSFEFVYKVTPFNKEMALYLRTSAGESGGTVAMTSYQAIPLEMLYPGAWRDADPPDGEGWLLLVGCGQVGLVASAVSSGKESAIGSD
jgi:hypothetical protein